MKYFLTMIVTLTALAGCASYAEPASTMEKKTSTSIVGDPDLIQTTSAADFETTLAQLKSAIDSRGFKTFAVIDHAKGAASVGQTLRPTTLIIFGNPKGGTPVLQAEQLMGLELPLKILLTENSNGAVVLTHNDMRQLFSSYGVEADGPLMKISGALRAITNDAAMTKTAN